MPWLLGRHPGLPSMAAAPGAASWAKAPSMAAARGGPSLQCIPHWNNHPSCFTKHILVAFVILLYKLTESNCLCKQPVWFDSAFLSLFCACKAC